MTRLILSDTEIVQAINIGWPEPYQTEVMATIALCESGGNVFACNPVGDPNSLFYRWDDKGLLQINEGAINDVLSTRVDPRNLYIVQHNVSYGRAIWDWRFRHALNPTSHGGLGVGYSAALVFAYNGWTTYRRRNEDEILKHAWSVFRPRIRQAMAELGLSY